MSNGSDGSESRSGIQRQQVLPAERWEVLRRLFGDRGPPLQRTCFEFMRRFAPGYAGGDWTFYILSNGGFYMAPPDKCHYELTLCEGLLSADAVGIKICLMVYSELSAVGIFSEHFHQLREYALTHAERARIL